MSDRIAVMQGGDLQVGAPMEIYERPKTRFVADFIGETNFLSGKVTAVGAEVTELEVAGQRVRLAHQTDFMAEDSRVTLAIRPEKVSLGRPEMALRDKTAQALICGHGARGCLYRHRYACYLVGLASGETMVGRVQTAEHGPGEFVVGEDVIAWCNAGDVRLLTA